MTTEDRIGQIWQIVVWSQDIWEDSPTSLLLHVVLQM